MSIATKCTCHMSSNGYCNSGVKECTQLMSENKSPIGGYAPDTDARSQAPTFDEMVAMIEKLFKDYLKDVGKKAFTDKQIEEGWQRYKTLNHLYQDEQPKPAGAPWVKGEYERLYEQVKSGKQRVCYVDYNWYREDLTKATRDICILYPKTMHFMSRGHTFGGVSHMEGDEKINFIELCCRMNVEWLDESGAGGNNATLATIKK